MISPQTGSAAGSSGGSSVRAAADADFASALDLIRLHCHPRAGARYWIEKVAERGIDVDRDLRQWPDLLRFGWMDEEALRRRPLEDFIPAGELARREPFHLAETSGFLGRPKTAAFSPEEFDRAFIQPFQIAAVSVKFPTSGRWLWIGPSGPHPIGQAARILARSRGHSDPFSVDFDPRWFNKLAAGSMARQRYMDHLIEQAMTILDRERIDIIFTTPSVLEKLADVMNETQRRAVRGVHYGGQSIDGGRLEKLKNESFPRAVHLAGYGNSLFGVCMEVETPDQTGPCYFPFGRRLRVRIVDASASHAREPSEFSEVDPRSLGRVVLDRLDRTMMILNMLERDEATRIAPSPGPARLGFARDGLQRPQLAAPLRATRDEGIY